MSDKKKLPKSQPQYARQPGTLITLQRRLDALTEFSDGLLNLIVQNLPAVQQQAQTLVNTMQQRTGQIKAADGALMLQGHGPRGVLFSQTITTEKQNKAFNDTLPKPAEHPLTIEQLMGELQNYLMLDQFTPEGVRRGWFLPDAENFGALLHELTDGEVDLTDQPDGIYVAANGGQGVYTLKLTVGEDILVFTPSNGPIVLTYSDLEKVWIGHTAYQFMDGAKTLEALRGFFSRANVHDVTAAELKRLDVQVRKLTSERLGTVAVVTGDSIDLPINELFKVRLPNDGEAAIVGVRDDFSWNDLTPYTRRQLFREVTRGVAAAASGPAPKAAKKSAKK